jgi:hypothetical protein
VVVEVVVVVPAVPGTFLGILASFLVVFPSASPDVPAAFALAFLSWCLSFAVTVASERQQRDLFLLVKGLEDSFLVTVG